MWILICLFFVVAFIWSLITAPLRSAKSLKNIEKELKRRG
jgi:hypothetical protein